jgi:pyruvate dehydrogenase E2 component (dihydrolipoamide acetyltransferase)
MNKPMEIKVPDIGDFKEVEVIEVLVSPGDRIRAEQSLITVESDKASMEIPASEGGVVKSVKVKVGDKVNQGSVILEVEGAGEAPAAATTGAVVKETESDEAVSDGGEVELKVPDIGDFKEVQVIEVMMAEGDVIKAEQSLITVESDKASMEIPALQGGVVKSVRVKVGDKVAMGSVIAVVQSEAQAEHASAPPQTSPREEPSTASTAPAPAASGATQASRSTGTAAPENKVFPSGHLPHASPSVRKFARELGVDLGKVKGTGPKQRITAEDVRAFVKQALAGGGNGSAGAADGAALGLLPWPKVDFAQFGSVQAKPLSRIKKISGANLHRNWVMIPHVTNHDVADITDLEALRVTLNKENEPSGLKVTLLAFLIKALATALKKFPEFNASLDGDHLILKQYYHIGFAADTPNGLVVPVVREADRKGILELARETAELAKKAREGKISPAEMQGGCFSISSLGGIGGTSFTPIINAPEVAILGVSRSAYQPVWDGKQFVARLMLPLSLSYDHRVIDGASAARFNAYLVAILADFRRIAL